MRPPIESTDGIVEEIMKIHRSLPPRPDIDEVEAAAALIRVVEKEEKSQVEVISKQKKGARVPDELFSVLEDMQRSLVYLQSRDQKREALKLLDLEHTHAHFDDLIQKASRCLSSPSPDVVSVSADDVAGPEAGFFSENEVGRRLELTIRDDSYLEKGKSVKAWATHGEDIHKLGLIKLVSLIEVSSKKGTRDLNLQNKLSDQVDWLPASIGKLSGLISLNLSENRIINLPTSIGALPSLTKLDLHANCISHLPDSIGDLFSLLCFDLRGNQITSIPSTLGQLAHLSELDLSSNRLSSLSDAIGSLVNLKKLNIEANDVEELPHTIGNCVSLIELRADYNHLKCLPEAIGRLESLEILSMRYNNVKGLPTTMASLSKLKELDVSFNELESIPESLCLATALVKLNVGSNFADLQSLPRSIGNLEMLEELDISNNQIRVFPDSFGMLTHLRVLHAEENPLELPPRHIAKMEAQAVVEYMAQHVARRAIRSQPLKTIKTFPQFCMSRTNRRKT